MRRAGRYALALALLACTAATAAAAQDTPSAAAEDRAALTARNRAVIEAFADLFYRQLKVREAYEKYVAADYRQHNPMATDGREAAIGFLEPYIAANPGLTMEVKRILVDGDLAAVHLLGKRNAADRGLAAVDILRLKDGKIVEHWDVTQAVPATSANPHPMF